MRLSAALAATALLVGAPGCGGTTARDTTAAFVAVGDEGTILRRADTASAAWEQVDSGVAVRLNALAFSQGLFVAVGDTGTILTSADGRTWTKRRTPSSLDLTDVYDTGTELVTVGGDASARAVALRSTDGLSWVPLEAPSSYSFESVTAAGTVLVSARKPSNTSPEGNADIVLASVPPTTSNRGGWRERADVPPFVSSCRIDKGGVATVGNAGGQATLARTEDGERWVTRDVPVASARGLATSAERWVVVGGSQAISTDDGAATWNVAVDLTGADLTAVTVSSGRFVAVGGAGRIYGSDTGEDWATEDSGTTAKLRDVAFAPAP